MGERRLRIVEVTWSLLLFNVLVAPASSPLGVPHRVAQALTQGALAVAFVLALSVNPKARVRPSLFLTLYTVLAVTSLMMSVRLVSLGTAYRGFRLLVFLLVLWLLTPWWGRRDLFLLRSQLRLLVLVLASVLLGLVIFRRAALPGGRLIGTIWSIPSTQVAHYAAELTGVMLLLWMCGLVGRRLALAVAVPSLAVLLLTHTRTALVALAAGFLVAALSLFMARRRVRRAIAGLVVTVAIVGLPLSPFVVHWLERGESTSQLADLTGRTNFWGYVLAEHRPETNKILGSGLSNGSIVGSNSNGNGLSIDSSWVEVYQDQGIVGDVLVGAMFLLLLLLAAFSPRGPTRALALFLVVYCLISSLTEDGAGIASQYALDMTVAASLLAPSLGGAAGPMRMELLGNRAGSRAQR
jgi:hypothetical protein